MPFKPETKNTIQHPELLSPAGNWECLVAGIENGADAVYLGTQAFNARAYARNFSFSELQQAITYCHDHGVRLYLTLNTLVKNEELTRFFDVLSRVYTLGIDGVIIQHLSLLDIIKDNYPGLAVFLSTQAALGNAAGTALAKRADRIILPRELTPDEIKKIIASGVSVEIFVHGALCFSYSGLCLFSSFVSSRSGNRGTCAQLCRQKYNDCYPLSTRELCLVRRIPELIPAGITGFKIEGRMRSPLYVAVATRLYRKAIDSYLKGNFVLPQKELAEIEVVFNREFTEGFCGEDKKLISSEKPMNRGAFLGVVGDNQITLQRSVVLGDGIGIWSQDNVSGTVIKQISLAGKRVKSASRGEKVNFGIDLPDGARIFLTAAKSITTSSGFTINRTPLVIPLRQPVHIRLPSLSQQVSRNLKLLVKAYSLAEAEESLAAGADIAFYNIFAADFPAGSNIGAYLPRIMDDTDLSRVITLLKEKIPSAIMTGNIGFLTYRDDFKIPVYLDYSINVFNDLDILFLQKYRAIPMASPELSLRELMSFRNKNIALFCHGDIILANTLIEINEKKLHDERGNTFPVRQEGNYYQILNSKPFGLFNDILKLRDAGFSQFFIDKQGEGPHFTTLYRDILGGGSAGRAIRRGHTAGHLYRPVT